MPVLTLPVLGTASNSINSGLKGQNSASIDQVTAKFAALLDHWLASEKTGTNSAGQPAGKKSGTLQTVNSPAGKAVLDLKDFLAGFLSQLNLSSGSEVKGTEQPPTEGAKQTVKPESGTNPNAELAAMVLAQFLLGGLQQGLPDSAGSSQTALTASAATGAAARGYTGSVPAGFNAEQILAALAAMEAPAAGNRTRGPNMPGVTAAVGNTALAEEYANLLKTLPNKPVTGENGFSPQTQTALIQSVSALLQELSGSVQAGSKAASQSVPPAAWPAGQQNAAQAATQTAVQNAGQNAAQAATQTAVQNAGQNAAQAVTQTAVQNAGQNTVQAVTQTAVQNAAGTVSQNSASYRAASETQWGGNSLHSVNARAAAVTAKNQPVKGESVSGAGQVTFGDGLGTGRDTTQSGHSDGQQSHSERPLAGMLIPVDKGLSLGAAPGADGVDTVPSAPGGPVEVWQQISNGLAEHLGKGSPTINELTLQMQPEKLGKIQIALSWNDKQVSLHIVAADDSTVKMLQGHMQDLRNSLESAGVSCGSLNLGFNGGFNRSWQQNAFQTMTQNSPRNSQSDIVPTEEQRTGFQTLSYDTQANEPYRINVTA